jgi:Flp pilus assembly protein TadD
MPDVFMSMPLSFRLGVVNVALNEIRSNARVNAKGQTRFYRRWPMRSTRHTLHLSAAFLTALLLPFFVAAQAPPAIQFFMPDGSLPPRELRFTLTSGDGRIEAFYTDSKGKFLMTRKEGLKPDSRYTITILSDGRAFETTTVTFQEHAGVYYIPIFLKPLDPDVAKPVGVIDLAELDTRAPKEAREAYYEGMRAARAGHATEAVNQLKRALTIYPNYFRALNDLGVLNMKVNRLDEAAKVFGRAIEIAPRVYYPRLNLGIIRTRQAKYKEAIDLLEQLHKDNPALLEVRVPLADALMATNRLDEAEGHLRAALADDKLDREVAGDAHYKLGLLLNRKQRFNEAVKELHIAAKVLPNSARIHLQLGGALVQGKQFDEAEHELLEAYRLGGAEMGAAQFLLGELYFLEKKYESAQRAFEQYLADVPKAPNAAEVRGVIERIKAALDRR